MKKAEAQAAKMVLVHEREDSSAQKAPKYVRRDPDATSATLLAAIGIAFTVVGLTDLALLWLPVQLGNAAWEFATVSRTFDNLPLTGLGLVLLAYGVVRHPARDARWVRGAAALFVAAAVLLLAVGLLYALASLAVLREMPAQGFDALGRAIVKNGVQIVVYPTVFAGMAVALWRGISKR